VTSEGASLASVRRKVSTGYGRLDEALHGGFLSGSMVVLNAPASDEVPTLLRQFLQVDPQTSLLICRTFSSAETVTRDSTSEIKSLVCSDRPVPPSKNIIPGKGIDNLTDVNLRINEALGSVQPKRIVLDILSDVLLRHKGLQTRRWLTDLLERLRTKNITTLAALNPYMHSSEDVQAVVDLYDGNLEIIEKDVEGSLRKFLRVKWMHGIDIAEKEFMLLELASQPVTLAQPLTVQTTSLKQPRWRTTLISRKEELDKLKTAFEEALRNRASTVALRGEAGVGKSRLMQELAAYAQSQGAVVLSGRASGDGRAYGPWIEVTRQYVGLAPGELLRRMLRANVSELVKWVPDLPAKLGTIPSPRTGSEQQNKNQFYEAIAQFFITIAQQTPILILLDDMENADAPSAELLEYLARRTSDLRILTVCSTIPGADANSPLEQKLLRLNKERLMENVRVLLLDKEGTTSLIKETFGEQTVTPEFADLIHQRTKGNPFFIEEILRSLVDDGTLFRTERGWDRKPIQEIKLPDSVKTALKLRLTRLEPEATSTLEWAAMIGQMFEFEVLRDVSGVSENRLLELLETANNQSLILELPNEPGKLAFQDERIRELLVEEVMQLKRRRYHHKIAEAMEKLYGQNLEPNSDQIATHYELAGNREPTIEYSTMAGDWNLSIHAYEQATNNYKRALDLTDLNESTQRSTLLEKQAEAYNRAGKFHNSLEAYQEALKLMETLEDRPSCARISAKLSWGISREKGLEEAVRFLMDAVKYVRDSPECFEAASLYGTLAEFLAGLDRYEECNVWSKRALEAGERTGNYAAVANALYSMGGFLLDTGRIDEGLPLMERSLEVAQKYNLFLQTVAGFLNLACYRYPRDLTGARDTASRWLAFGKQQNLPSTQAAALVCLAFLDMLRGEWEMALKWFRDAFELKNRVGFNFIALNAEAERAELYMGLGELEKAEQSCQLALGRRDEQVTHVVATNLALGKLRVEEGRVEKAQAYFEAGVKAFKNYEFTTMPLLHVEVLLHLSKIYAQQGRFEDARGLVDWARRLGETLKSDAGLAMASEAEANLLHAKGDLKASEEVYLKSLSLWERAGWPYYHAKILVAYSESIAQANPEEAKKRLQQAVDIYKRLGAKRDLEKAEATLSGK